VRGRYEGSTAEGFWNRLSALEFVDRATQFAGVLLLCFFPFLIVVTSLAGRSAVTGLVRRLGLDHEAALHVGALFTSSVATASAVGGVSYVFFVISGLAAAGALQTLYQRAFDVPGKGLRDLPYRAVWLGAATGVVFAVSEAATSFRHALGPVALFLLAVPLVSAFWGFTAWLLLARRATPRELLPTALATGVCWVAMQAVFARVFSDMVNSNYRQYGQIGVVFALMSWLVAIGVVILIGAAAGVAWRERGELRSSSP
jgi:membrane protein